MGIAQAEVCELRRIVECTMRERENEMFVVAEPYKKLNLHFLPGNPKRHRHLKDAPKDVHRAIHILLSLPQSLHPTPFFDVTTAMIQSLIMCTAIGEQK